MSLAISRDATFISFDRVCCTALAASSRSFRSSLFKRKQSGDVLRIGNIANSYLS